MSTPSLDSDARNVNETRSGGRLETSHLVHGREFGIIQSLVGVSALDDHVALVQLESDKTVDGLLRGRNGGADELSLGGEEETVVKDLRKVDGDELISHGSDISVQGHTLEIHVSNSEDGSSRRLVASSRLDTDESVLDNVDSTDTVLSGEGIEREEDINSVGDNLAIGGVGHFDGQTLGKFNLDLLGLLGGLLRGSGQFPHVIGRGLVGVLEDTGFVRDVEQVFVGRPWLGSGLHNGDTVASGVLEKGGSTSESVVELGQSPWGDDVDVGGKTVKGELESDLVVSFTSTSVRDEAVVSMDELAREGLTRNPLEGRPRSYLEQ